MAFSVFLMMLEGSTLAILSKMMEPIFDRVLIGGDLGAVWWVGGIIFGLFAIRGTTDLIKKVILARISQRSSTEMQADLLRHMMTLDSTFFFKNPPGALMERIQGDTVAVQGVWSVIIQGLGRDIFSLFWLLVLALSIDWVWTVVAIIAVPVLIFPIAGLQQYIRRKTRQMREEATNRSTRLDEIFHGIQAAKLYQMEDYQAGRFESIVDRIVRAELKIAAGRAMIPSLVDFATGLGFLGVIYVGAQDIIEGEKTAGQFMAFFTAMSLTFQPLRRLGSTAGTWQVAVTSLARLFWLFDQKPSIAAPKTPANVPEDLRIDLSNVTLSYGENPVLRGIDLTIEEGQTVALVGASGAGKSSIFNTLTRLVDPQEGTITVGGQDIRHFNLTELRALFSVVSQETLLFDETIRNNILLGHHDIEPAALAQALDAAHVSDFITTLPDGLDTEAGPRGANLSGGQRQRVSIARALLRNAPILLLDEATSALDTKSEALVQTALDSLRAGRTTLVIAHRLSTIQNADKIIVMDHGKIVETGTHAELLKTKGVYAQLHAMQSDT
nr:ABC transporter ATP-binding protein [Cochlodiniinecator piscidefendens]